VRLYSRHDRPVLGEVKHLAGVEDPLELVHQLDALVIRTVRVDEDKKGFDVRRRDVFDDERHMVCVLFGRLLFPSQR